MVVVGSGRVKPYPRALSVTGSSEWLIIFVPAFILCDEEVGYCSGSPWKTWALVWCTSAPSGCTWARIPRIWRRYVSASFTHRNIRPHEYRSIILSFHIHTQSYEYLSELWYLIYTGWLWGHCVPVTQLLEIDSFCLRCRMALTSLNVEIKTKFLSGSKM